MDTGYVYTRWKLTETDPRLDQPAKIRVALKPHQLTAAYRMVLVERTNRVRVHPPLQERENVRTNVGFLGDIPGHGKTLTMLSVIASNNVFHENIHYASGISDSSGGLYASSTHTKAMFQNVQPIRSTLIIVPRGLVYKQWCTALSTQTTLAYESAEKMLDFTKRFPAPDASAETLRAWFEGKDAILLSGSFVDAFIARYASRLPDITCWCRIVIDEAQDIKIPKMPQLQAGFLWYVTASYQTTKGGRWAMARILSSIPPRFLQAMAVVNEPDYVRRSFEVPDRVMLRYRVKPPPGYAHLLHAMEPNVRAMLAANDIAGVVAAMGGQVADQDDLVGLLTRRLTNQVRNLERKLEMYHRWEGNDRQALIDQTQHELVRARQELEGLRQRIEQADRECPLCFNEVDVPATLPCAHRFCGQCIYGWLLQRPTCPMCRVRVRPEQILTVLPPEAERPPAVPLPADPTDLRHLGKNEAVVHLLQQNPQGKFLLFSRFDATFRSLMDDLVAADVPVEELKGSSGHMQQIIDRFRNGRTRVLFLHAHFMGSGIDLSMASDVILYHAMPDHEEQAVGRAHRVGRTSALRVHKLCFPDEMR